MRKLTREEKLATPGYARNVQLFRWFYLIFGVGVAGAWLSVKLLPANPELASGRWMDVVRFIVPSVDLLAKRCPDPQLATAVYGLQWLLAPCYLVLLFTIGPWSSTSRAALRYTAQLLSPSRANKLWLLVVILLLITYFLGDLRLFYFPTFLNGGIAPVNDQGWLAGIYRSYFALGVFGAVAVACECLMFWVVVFFVWNVDIWLLGHGVTAEASQTQRLPPA